MIFHKPCYCVRFITSSRQRDIFWTFCFIRCKVIIAGAGGAAHLPGMMASHTQIPVIGVPIESTSLNGIDSLLSIVQMPKGIPVATVSIGKTGAKNAAILAAEILSLQDEQISKKLSSWKISMTNNVPYKPE